MASAASSRATDGHGFAARSRPGDQRSELVEVEPTGGEVQSVADDGALDQLRAEAAPQSRHLVADGSDGVRRRAGGPNALQEFAVVKRPTAFDDEGQQQPCREPSYSLFPAHL